MCIYNEYYNDNNHVKSNVQCVDATLGPCPTKENSEYMYGQSNVMIADRQQCAGVNHGAVVTRAVLYVL